LDALGDLEQVSVDLKLADGRPVLVDVPKSARGGEFPQVVDVEEPKR
jgi:hypothetical protein